MKELRSAEGISQSETVFPEGVCDLVPQQSSLNGGRKIGGNGGRNQYGWKENKERETMGKRRKNGMRMYEREIKREEKEINTEKEREGKMQKERGWIT